jgi:hypothetical protein
MSTAKYYIYRNLRTGGFSVRYRGRVIERLHTFSATNVEFKVNESARQRVIKENQKNVHAFVICDNYTVKLYPALSFPQVAGLHKISYNPYTDTTFMCNGRKINKAQEIVFQNGRCFLIK